MDMSFLSLPRLSTLRRTCGQNLPMPTVNAMRSTTAAPEPQKTALRCWCGGRERAASAMTTAMSPERMLLIQTILTRPIQKSALRRNSMT